ncbi:MAG: hypothetical protein HQM04_10245 [Magnetococcales bacterium]|nr:hypothetical protein [Magnetococcales bacterium]MBF0115411.1 hypothetical protein [Magnetococcales bacterium]
MEHLSLPTQDYGAIRVVLQAFLVLARLLGVGVEAALRLETEPVVTVDQEEEEDTVGVIDPMVLNTLEVMEFQDRETTGEPASAVMVGNPQVVVAAKHRLGQTMRVAPTIPAAKGETE